MNRAAWTGAIAALMVAGGMTAGFAADPAPADWIGEWSAGPEQSISITQADNGGLRLEGFATWGAYSPERVERGAINVGEFLVTVPADWIGADNAIRFAVGSDGAEPFDMADEYSCAVELFLRGAELEARENGNCGGFNVSFDGIYTRKP